jgi:hypothetical protein
MERAAIEHIEAKIREEVTKRFPGAAIEKVSLLQYGDDPVIEPGELLLRIFVQSGESETERENALQAFEHEHHGAIEEFNDALGLRMPEIGRVEFRAGTGKNGPRLMRARGRRSLEARALAGGDLTPVMARLGPADLETLDTLITAGIAPSRAEAIRWALARIRERPAFEQLRNRARELEELKAQF